MTVIVSYKDLEVWKKAIKLTVLVYSVTKLFPKEELYGIVNQIRRCVVSIPSNIAEGYSRHSRLEYLHFLKIANGSGAELETQLIISEQLKYIPDEKYDEIYGVLQEIMRMLNSLILKLKNP